MTDLSKKTSSLRSYDVVSAHTQALATAKFTETQICRTCVFDQKRFSGDINEFRAAQADGTGDAYMAAHSCAPQRYASTGLHNLHEDSTMSSFREGEMVTTISIKKPSRIIGTVETCGQQIQAKCLDCGNFRAERVSVIGGQAASGRPWHKWMAVGGHCGLVDRCAPVPKSRDQADTEHNCWQCANNQTFNNDWQLEHGEVVEMDLLNYAKNRVLAAEEEPSMRNLAVYNARAKLGKVMVKDGPQINSTSLAPWGTLFSFKADVLDVVMGEIMLIDDHAQKSVPGLHLPANLDDTGHDPLFAIRAACRLWGQYQYSTVWEFLARWKTPEVVQAPVAKPVVKPAPPAITKKVITKWLVNFRNAGGGVATWIDAANADYTIGVITELSDPSQVMVTIQSPWHRRYGIEEPHTRKTRQTPRTAECRCTKDTSWYRNWAKENSADWHTHPYVDPECQRCAGTGWVHDITPKTFTYKFNLVGEAMCPRCELTKPCYYHTKTYGRTINAESGEIENANTIYDEMRARIDAGVWAGVLGAGDIRTENHHQLIREVFARNNETNPTRILVLTNGVVTDADGNEPDIALFNVWLRSLLAFHPQWASQIRSQFHAAWSALPKVRNKKGQDKEIPIDHNFGRPMSVQPWAPYCTAYLHDQSMGMNFRVELGDNWGDPRSSQGTNPMTNYSIENGNYFSWKKYLALQEFLRVTNPGERLQEVMSSSERHNKERSAGLRVDVDWENWTPTTTTQYDAMGIEDGDSSISDVVRWLDQERVIELRNAAGDIETFKGSNRFLMFGYDNFRGGRQLSKEDVAPVWALRAAEDMDHGDLDVYIGFLCTMCGTKWAIDEAIAKDLVCDHFEDKDGDPCGGSIAWFATGRNAELILTEMKADQIAPDDIYRRKLDDTMTVVADNERWQQEEMLRQLGHHCPQWRPRGRRGGPNWKYRTPVQAGVEVSEWLGRKVVYVLGGYDHSPQQIAEFHDTGNRNNCPLCVSSVVIEGKHLDDMAAYPLIRAMVFSRGAKTITYDAPAGPQIVEILSIEDPIVK